jgi:hypothetical protein
VVWNRRGIAVGDVAVVMGFGVSGQEIKSKIGRRNDGG